MATPTTPILANRYLLGSIVYSDSAVVAYQAHDQMLKRAVTVELLRPDKAKDSAYVQRMLDKAHQAALVSLPHVAALYDQSSVDQRPFLVLEELAGPPLDNLAPLPAEQAIALVAQIAETLEAGLASGQPLPEINGQTIRINPDGRVQLIDLGLEQTLPTQVDAVKTLGHSLKLALTGSTDLSRVTPLCMLADRAIEGDYASVGDFLAELHTLQQRADTPTTMIPRMHPTIPIPNAATSAPPLGGAAIANAPSPPPLVAEERPAPQPRQYLWGIAAAGLILLFLGGNWALRERESAPSPSPSAAAGESPAASASASAVPTGTGQIFVVNTQNRQSLVVRTGPGRAFPRIVSLPYGTQVEVVGEPQAADGYNWVRIRTANVDGWCVSEALRKP